MFFFKKKKPTSKNKLPEKLISLKHALQPSWVWDAEYRIIVWSNNEGLKFWKVDNREEIKELIFPENNAMVLVCDKNIKKLQSGTVLYETITFPTRPTATNFICRLQSQDLPDGRSGVLITLQAQQKGTGTSEKGDNYLEAEFNNLEAMVKKTNNIAVPSDPVAQIKTIFNHSNLKNQKSDILSTTPLTLSCNHLGKIISVNDIGQTHFNMQKGSQFEALFVDKHISGTILQRALSNEKLSFVQKMNIGYGDFPFLIQTTQFVLNDKSHLNIGILQISEEKYQDFLTNEADNFVAPKAVSDADFDADFGADFGADDMKHHESEVESENDFSWDSFAGDANTNEHHIFNKHKNHHVTNDDEKYMSSALIGDMTGIGIFNVKKDGFIKAVNQIACKLMGYDEAVLIGKNIVDLFGSEAKPVLIELIVNQNNAVLHDLENGVRCQYDDAQHIEHIAKLVVKPNQSSDGFWFVLNDNTELEKIKSELSELRNLKNDNLPTVKSVHNDIQTTQIPHFVNSVSHEIRAPLNAIAGYAEMIESEVFGKISDPRYKEYATSIRGAGEYALTIVSELLDYSKLKAGGFTAQFSDVDIQKSVTEAFEIVYPHAHSRKIELVKTVLTGTPNIHSDARLLKQILINLLTNAIKYSQEGEQVILTAGLTKTGRFMIEITDFGRGMTKQEIHEALTPFTRGNAKNDVPGTGLGLSLSKELCELIHARFMIDSVPNERTRVRIIYEKTSVL